MTLSIVIVSWNTRELLTQCLQSILASDLQPLPEIIVVDNNSTDGSTAKIKQDFPVVKLIANQTNAGYAGANNQGIKLAQGDYILLLNPDTAVKPETLRLTVEYLVAHPSIGVLGCRLLNSDGTLQLSVRHFPNLISQIILLTKLHNFFPRLINNWLRFDFDYRETAEVDQVMGAFMLIRRAVINQVGLLDEKFWSWYEDVDYCQRVKAAGWQVVYFAGAEIVHHKGSSFAQQLPLRKQKTLIKSLLYYFKKYHGWPSYLILLPFAGLGLFLAAGVQIFGIKKKNRQL